MQSRLATFELFVLGSEVAVVDALFDAWTPDLVMKLRPLSSSMLLAVEAYRSRRWNIDSFLEHWFTEPQQFIKTLKSCDGLVSGSEAQQFFARCEFRGRDLDIYVPFHGLLEMGRWLKGQGFIFQASADKHPLFDAAALMFTSHAGRTSVGPPPPFPGKPLVFSAFNFVRFCNWNSHHPLSPPGRHAQVIAVPDTPVNFIINNFHSTGVMNYFTATHAVSFFPRTTFVSRKTLVCQDTTRNAFVHHNWMKKYRKRGFEVVVAGDKLPDSLELRTWHRRVGDGLMWTLPFTAFTLPPTDTTSPLDQVQQIPFEVLPYHFEVAAAGAALRIGPRFVYSSMSVVADPYTQLGSFYHSAEVAAAFDQYYEDDMVMVEEGELTDDEDAETQDDTDTGEDGGAGEGVTQEEDEDDVNVEDEDEGTMDENVSAEDNHPEDDVDSEEGEEDTGDDVEESEGSEYEESSVGEDSEDM